MTNKVVHSFIPLYRDKARPKHTLTPEEEAARREKRLQATWEKNRHLRSDPAYLANKTADMHVAEPIRNTENARIKPSVNA